MKSPTELKNCPYCGGKAGIKHVSDKNYYPYCTKCYVAQESIKSWNNRAEKDRKSIGVEEIEALISTSQRNTGAECKRLAKSIHEVIYGGE